VIVLSGAAIVLPDRILNPGTVVIDEGRIVEIRPEAIRHRHKLTPYQGRKLHGAVRATVVGGRIAYIDDESQAADRAAGRLLTRTTT